jgi:CheY-like chemotaxis protein
MIVDYAMPFMNGAQLASDVKRLRPSLPIIFVTGYMRDDGLRIWAETGHIVLQKPFSFAQLATAIRDAMDTAEAAAKIVPLTSRAS